MTICIWIHGIQSGDFDAGCINNCIRKVSEQLPQGQYIHHVSDWGSVVFDRQRQVFNLVKSRGNWLTVKIRQAMCSLGLDMWMWLATKAGNAEGDWAHDIRALLDGEVEKLEKANSGAKIALIAHSWGGVISLDYFIRHHAKAGTLITMGSPAPTFGSACFKNWGDPKLLKNVTAWHNIATPNDPISYLMRDNPNPDWQGIVKEHDIFSFNPFPMTSHSMYFKNKKVHKIIAAALH